ncbi:MAG: cell division protein FtsZ [Candidatus Pacebacteria bacterium]|nr:cell division protein FtsZ [Candidatus Paceibacterota bacterium]
MPKINTEIESFARIKIIGVGGAGKNATNYMIKSKVQGVEFIAINTDAQDLHHSLAKKKIHIGKNLTNGLGAGMNPEIGRRAAEETAEEIQDVLKGANMVFITAGFGGGTGTGGAPIIAKAAKDLGILTVAVVTKPFMFEGAQRSAIAEEGLARLKDSVDALIIIPNDRILSVSPKGTTMDNAFEMSDKILKEAVEGISDLITVPGKINVDFADILTIMGDAGSALMGIGKASGENRAEEAALQAINSPLLDISIAGAKGVLLSVSGGDDLTINEIQEAARIVTESISPDAKVIFGTSKTEKLKKNEIKITVIATGFKDTNGNGGGLFQRTPKKEEPVEEKVSIFSSGAKKEEKKEKEKEKEVIKEPEKKKKEVPKPNPKPKILEIPQDDDDDDTWDAIPSFLRRSKLK